MTTNGDRFMPIMQRSRYLRSRVQIHDGTLRRDHPARRGLHGWASSRLDPRRGRSPIAEGPAPVRSQPASIACLSDRASYALSRSLPVLFAFRCGTAARVQISTTWRAPHRGLYATLGLMSRRQRALGVWLLWSRERMLFKGTRAPAPKAFRV
jgi:hypothetical protein